MEIIIVEVSKYLICALMLLYVTESFIALSKGPGAERSTVCLRMRIWMFLIGALMFAQIVVNTGKPSYLFYFLFIAAIIIITPLVYGLLFPGYEPILITHMCMFLMIGMTVILRVKAGKMVRQMIIVSVSVLIGFLFIWVLKKMKKPLASFKYAYLAIGFVSILAVLLIGATTYGSRLSITVLGLTFQPSEFVKMLYVLFIASALYLSHDLLQIFITAACAAAHVLVLVFSKDLGSALIYFVVYIVMLYAATGKARWPLAGLLLMIVASFVAYRLFGHVRTRVDVFLNPWATIDSTGYQITQSLFAISGGGFFGMGLFGGIPTTIPFVEEDVIFAAIAEELGVVFALLLLAVCVSMFLDFMSEAYYARDRFKKLVFLGIGTTYIFQVFLTVGGGTKFIPLTGVTLPLVSYGGSSVLSTIISLALCEGLILRPDDEFPEYEPDSKREQTGTGKLRKKSSRREKWRNPNLVISAITVILMTVMMVYIGLHSYADRKDLMRYSYNKHQALYMKTVKRGDIVDRNGVVLATTTLDENGRQMRKYPFGRAFAHVIGYSVKDMSGVEEEANYELLHTNIPVTRQAALAAKGELYPGNMAVTTLDSRLQETIYQAMQGYRGAVIVTNPKTGEILALCVTPSFDPETIDEDWETYTTAKDATVGGGVLVNRVTQGLYPAGSTFKIITSLAYLKEHHDSDSDYSYDCTGQITLDGETIRCFDSYAHGQVSLESSFALSCNSSFVNIGVSTDRKIMAQTLKDLYFAKALPCDLTTNQSATVDPLTANTKDLMQFSIGQGKTQMTPLHMNMITAAIANGGVMMRPYVLSGIADSDGKIIADYGSHEAGRVMNTDEAAILTQMMRSVVTDGTGVVLRDRDYKACGKTGSAEHGKLKDTESTDNAHAWFTGFAPYDNPEICVTVILEDAGSSSSFAVPLSRIIFDTYFGQ